MGGRWDLWGISQLQKLPLRSVGSIPSPTHLTGEQAPLHGPDLDMFGTDKLCCSLPHEPLRSHPTTKVCKHPDLALVQSLNLYHSCVHHLALLVTHWKPTSYNLRTTRGSVRDWAQQGLVGRGMQRRTLGCTGTFVDLPLSQVLVKAGLGVQPGPSCIHPGK